VNQYLDFEIPHRRGEPATLRQIMTHTAGFEEQVKSLIGHDRDAIPPYDELLKRWVPHRIFAPGTTPAYSNYATSLAGYQTYPHVDMYETGMRAAKPVLELLQGNAKPVLAFGHQPMLPHVMRYNEPVTAARQKMIAAALGRPELAAADAVAGLIAELGLPSTLRAVGVERERLAAVAEASMGSFWVHRNPRPLRAADDVMRLLEQAW
jgi:hypothetical protein